MIPDLVFNEGGFAHTDVGYMYHIYEEDGCCLLYRHEGSSKIGMAVVEGDNKRLLINAANTHNRTQMMKGMGL
jgi:hypothetical protein